MSLAAIFFSPQSGRVGVPCHVVVGWCLSAAAALGAPAIAAETAQDRDKAAIRAAAQAYQEALSRGDGAALAAFWTADGDIVDEQGNTLPGRQSAADVKKLSLIHI